MKRRRRFEDPSREPFKEYHDYDGAVQLGHADFGHHPYELTDDHVNELVDDIHEIEARRIRPGFWLPGESE